MKVSGWAGLRPLELLAGQPKAYHGSPLQVLHPLQFRPHRRRYSCLTSSHESAAAAPSTGWCFSNVALSRCCAPPSGARPTPRSSCPPAHTGRQQPASPPPLTTWQRLSGRPKAPRHLLGRKPLKMPDQVPTGPPPSWSLRRVLKPNRSRTKMSTGTHTRLCTHRRARQCRSSSAGAQVGLPTPAHNARARPPTRPYARVCAEEAHAGGRIAERGEGDGSLGSGAPGRPAASNRPSRSRLVPRGKVPRDAPQPAPKFSSL